MPRAASRRRNYKRIASTISKPSRPTRANSQACEGGERDAKPLKGFTLPTINRLIMTALCAHPAQRRPFDWGLDLVSSLTLRRKSKEVEGSPGAYPTGIGRQN